MSYKSYNFCLVLVSVVVYSWSRFSEKRKIILEEITSHENNDENADEEIRRVNYI